MPLRTKVRIGVVLFVVAFVVDMIGRWDVLLGTLPEWARTALVKSSLAEAVLALVGIYLLWSVADTTAVQETNARQALSIANDSNSKLRDQILVDNAELVRRLEASNADLRGMVAEVDQKLTKVLDEKLMDWAPAFQKLVNDFKADVQRQHASITTQFQQTLLAIARQTGAAVGAINTGVPPKDVVD